MMQQRILFRADASKTTGYGHFIRSLALAGYLKDHFDCCFASFNSDTQYKLPSNNQLQQILEICSPLELQGDNIEEYNDRFLDEIRSSDIVVLDNYYYTTEYQKKIKDKGCKLVCIDDVHNRHMVCDMLITVCPLEKKDFSVEPYTKFIGGIEYGFLRQPFYKKAPERNIQGYLKRIVLAMGGADAFNLTDKIASVVHNVVPEAIIDVIAGDTVSVTSNIESFTNVHKSISANEIVNIMDNADIGIFPASTICIEAISRRLPILAGYYADNQKEFYEYGVLHKYFSPIGCLSDSTDKLASRIEKVLEESQPYPTRIDFDYRKEEIIKHFIELSKY